MADNTRCTCLRSRFIPISPETASPTHLMGLPLVIDESVSGCLVLRQKALAHG